MGNGLGVFVCLFVCSQMYLLEKSTLAAMQGLDTDGEIRYESVALV